MAWTILFHPAFKSWLVDLEENLQDKIVAKIGLLQILGPALGRPHVDHIKDSCFYAIKELRVQYKRDPWRILFVFDPKRRAVILLGGNKRGDSHWYEKNLPIAEMRYQEYLTLMEKDHV